jgi:hypothetical protein
MVALLATKSSHAKHGAQDQGWHYIAIRQTAAKPLNDLRAAGGRKSWIFFPDCGSWANSRQLVRGLEMSL